MKDDHNILYTVNWSQDYADWQAFIEEIVEMRVEASGCTDAKEVINHIKSL